MSVLTYEGFVDRGQIRLNAKVRLPERAKVYVIVPDVPVESLSILDDWSHEGPDDPEEDRQLFAEALIALEEYGGKPETWLSLEAFEAELDRAEAAG